MRKSAITAIITVLLVVASATLLFNRSEGQNSKSARQSDNTKSTVSPPCGDAAKTVSIRRAMVGGEIVYFNTAGGDLYFTAAGFVKDNFATPNIDKTAVYIGSPDKLPVYDIQRATVSNTIVEFRVTEGEYSRQNLDKGRYWIWSSVSVEIKIASCGEVSL